MRMFMFIVVTYEMKMDEFDVRAAYLHSYLTETIYMKPPHGLERYDENGNELIWLLVKSLYGLRQSGHNWMVDFFSFLEGYGMSQSPADTSLWFLHKNGVPIIALFVHTDDGKIAYSDHLERDRFMDALCKRFDIGSQQEQLTRMFNIKVNYLPDGSFLLNQKAYIMDLARTYNLEQNPEINTPMSSHFVIKVKSELTEAEKLKMKTRPFLSLFSALLWVNRCTRHDISVALIVISRALSNPDPTHWNQLIRILTYLVNTCEEGLEYKAIDQPLALSVLVDASHASCPITGRSISGLYVTCGNCLLDWYCKHQPYTTLSSGEAETVAGATAVTHLLYWKQLFLHAFQLSVQTFLFSDSTTCRNILTNPIHNTSMKHIRTRLFFTREHARAGVFKLLHTPGDDNPSDALTKPLSFQRIQHLMQVLKSWGYRVLNFIRTSAQASADEPSAKRMKQTTAHADGDAF